MGLIKLGWAALRTGDNNTKLIVSSHGCLLKKSDTFRTNSNLHFAVYENKSARGQVDRIMSMSKKEFVSEPSGTTIRNHALTFYEYDNSKNIKRAVDAGFDVLTIAPNTVVHLEKILNGPKAFFGTAYGEIYGLFCRDSSVYEYSDTLHGSQQLMKELKQVIKKKKKS